MDTPEKTLEAALALHRAGRLAEAEAVYRQILAGAPQHPDALHLLGLVAHQQGDSRRAVELIGRAIGLHGNVAALHNNLGEAHRSLGEYPQAIAAYEQALRLDPNFAEAHNNLGTVLQNEGRLDEAVACFDRALIVQGDYANAHYNRARALLAQGNFAAGWPEYEWRWRCAEFRRPPLAQPEWDGSPLAGRRLLVRAEQGLGDTLQFIRYMPIVRRSGAQVACQVQSELVPLLERSAVGPVLAADAPLREFDVHASLLSLPGLLKTTLDTIPADVPYLAAEPACVERWRAKLSEIDGFRVGVFWQGNPRSPLEPWRSIPLTAFEPIATTPGVRLVSLQKGFGAEQIGAVADRFAVFDLGPELDEQGGAFLDSAAVLTLVDLLITSDSAVAHLAGALGVPVWVVLPTAADWRWLQARDDSPWYPTMRLFRQQRQGDWSSVMRQVATALSQRMRQPGVS